jgi:hypothetical protein
MVGVRAHSRDLRGAVAADYFPHLLLWLVTTPWQARLMWEALSRQAEVKATVLSLPEAQGLLMTVGDAAPATVATIMPSWPPGS